MYLTQRHRPFIAQHECPSPLYSVIVLRSEPYRNREATRGCHPLSSSLRAGPDLSCVLARISHLPGTVCSLSVSTSCLHLSAFCTSAAKRPPLCAPLSTFQSLSLPSYRSSSCSPCYRSSPSSSPLSVTFLRRPSHSTHIEPAFLCLPKAPYLLD